MRSASAMPTKATLAFCAKMGSSEVVKFYHFDITRTQGPRKRALCISRPLLVGVVVTAIFMDVICVLVDGYREALINFYGDIAPRQIRTL